MKNKYDGEKMIDEKTIWAERQNHPELVVEDCKKEFDLNEKQLDTLRFILLRRGINKWLLARRKVIRLKHKTKKLLREAQILRENTKNPYTKQYHLTLQAIHSEMQEICRMPRWVEWGKYHKDMRKNEKEIKIKGSHC
jgi:hypothetical protein